MLREKGYYAVKFIHYAIPPPPHHQLRTQFPIMLYNVQNYLNNY